MYNYEEQARSVNRPDPSFQNNINQPPASASSEVSKPATGSQWPVSRPVGILPPNYRTERSKNNHMTPLIESEQYQRTVRTNSTNQHNIIRPQPRTMPIDCQAGYNPYAYYPTRSAPHYVPPENVIGKLPMQFTASDPRYINGSQETLQKTPTDGRITNYPRYASDMVTSAQQNSVSSRQERISNHHIPFHDPQTKDTSHLNCTTCQTPSCAHIQRQTACAYAPPIPALQQPSGTWPGTHTQPDMWAIREEQRQMLPIEGIDMSVGNPYAMQYFERKNNDTGNTDETYKKQQAESYQIQKQQINKLKKLQSSISQHSRPVEWTHEGHGSSGIIQPYPLGRYPDHNQRGQVSRAIPSHLSLPMHSSMSSESYKLSENLNYINSNSHLHSRLTTSYPPTNQVQMSKGTSYFSHPHANYAAPVSSHHNMNPESASNQSFSKPTYSVSMSSYPNPPLNSCNERYENINYGQTMQVVDNSAGSKGGVPYQQELHQAYKPPAPNYFDPKSVNALEIPSSHMAYGNAMYRKSVMESVRASRHKLHPGYGIIPSSGTNVPGSRLIQNVPTNYQHAAPFVEMTLLDDCELDRKRRKQDEVHVIHSVNREPTENGGEKKRPADELRKFYENWDAEEVDESAEATLAETADTRKPQEMMVLDCSNLHQDNVTQPNEEICSETEVQAYKLESQSENNYTSVIKPLKERQKTSTKVMNPLRNFRKSAFAASESENLLTTIQGDHRETNKEANLVSNLESMSFLNESVGFSTQEDSANGSVGSIEATSKPAPVEGGPVSSSSIKDSHLSTESIISIQDLHDILAGKQSDSEKCVISSKSTSHALTPLATIRDALSIHQSQTSPLTEPGNLDRLSTPKESKKETHLLSQPHWDPILSVPLQNASNFSHSQHLSISSLTTDDSGVEADNVISIPDVDDDSKLNDDLFVANFIPMEHFKITKKKVKAFKQTKKPSDSVIKYVSSEPQKNQVLTREPVNNSLAYAEATEPLSAVDLSCKSLKSKAEANSKPIQFENHPEASQDVQLADSTTMDRLSHTLTNHTADRGSRDAAQTSVHKPPEDITLELASLCGAPGNDEGTVPTEDTKDKKIETLPQELDAQDLHSPRRQDFTDCHSISKTPTAVTPENLSPKLGASLIPSDLHNAERYSVPKPEILRSLGSLQASSPGNLSSPGHGQSPAPKNVCSPEPNVSLTPENTCSPGRSGSPNRGNSHSPERIQLSASGSSPSPQHLEPPATGGWSSLEPPASENFCSTEHHQLSPPANKCSPEHGQSPPTSVRSPEHLQLPAPGGWSSPERNDLTAPENVCSPGQQQSPPRSMRSPEPLLSPTPGVCSSPDSCRSPTSETFCRTSPTPMETCSPECHQSPVPAILCSPNVNEPPAPKSLDSPGQLESSPPGGWSSPECHQSPPRSKHSPEPLQSSTPGDWSSPECSRPPTPETICHPQQSPARASMCSPDHNDSPPPKSLESPEQLQLLAPENFCRPETHQPPATVSICSPDHSELPPLKSLHSPEEHQSLAPENFCSPEHDQSPASVSMCSPDHSELPPLKSLHSPEEHQSLAPENFCSPEHDQSPASVSMCSPDHSELPPLKSLCSPEDHQSLAPENVCSPESHQSPATVSMCSPDHSELPPLKSLHSPEEHQSLTPENFCSPEHNQSLATANTYSPDKQPSTPAEGRSPECNSSPASASLSSPEYLESPTESNMNADIETSISQSDCCTREETSVKSPYQTPEILENDRNEQPAIETLENSADNRETTGILNEDECMEMIEDDSKFPNQELADKLLYAEEDAIAKSLENTCEEIEMDKGNFAGHSNCAETAEDGKIISVETDLDLTMEGLEEECGDQELLDGHCEESPSCTDVLPGNAVLGTAENDEVVINEECTMELTTKSVDEENEPKCLVDNTAELLAEEQNGENLENLAVPQLEEEGSLVHDQETQVEVLKSNVSKEALEMQVEVDTADQLENSEFIEERLEFVSEEYDETREELSAELNEENSMDYAEENEVKNEDNIIDELQDEDDLKPEEEVCSEREEGVSENNEKNDEDQEETIEVLVQEEDEIDTAGVVEIDYKDVSEKLPEDRHEEFSICDADLDEEKSNVTVSDADVDGHCQELASLQDEGKYDPETSVLAESKNSVVNVIDDSPLGLIPDRTEQRDSPSAKGDEILQKEVCDQPVAFEEQEATLVSNNHLENQNGLHHEREDYHAEKFSSDEFFTPTTDFSSPSSDQEDAAEGVELDSPTEFNQHTETLENDSDMLEPVTAPEGSKDVVHSTDLETEPEICSKNSAIDEKSHESTLNLFKRKPLNNETESEVITDSCNDPPTKLGFARNKKEQDLDHVSKVSKSWSEWKKSRKNFDLEHRRNHIQLDPRLNRRSSPKTTLDEELKRDLELHASLTDRARVSIKTPDVNPRSNFLDSISAAFKNLDPLPLGEDLVSEIMNDFNDPETIAASPKSELSIACPDSEMPALEIGAVISPVNSESLEMPCLEAMSDPFGEPSSPNLLPVLNSNSVTSSPERCIVIEENREPISETFGPDEPLQNWPYLEEEVFSETPRNQSPVIETTCSGQAYSPAPSYTTDSDAPSSKDLTNVPCERNIYDKPLNVLVDTCSPIPQLKCSLSWDKIFNLSKTNKKNLRDIGIKSTGPRHKKILLSNLPDFCKKMNDKKDKKRSSLQGRDDEFDLELGPATIEVRLKPNGNRRQWNVVDGIRTENVPEMSLREENNNITESGIQTRNVKSPIVVVQRIILKRRAEEMNDSIANEVTRSQGPSCLTTPPESDDGSPGQKALPKVVIKRTRHGHSKYQSFLRLSEGDGSSWQPIVQIERNQLLENMVKRHVLFTNVPRGNCDKENEQVVVPSLDQILREGSTVNTPFTNLHGADQDQKIAETNGHKNSKYKARKHSKITKDKVSSKSILRRMLNSSKANTGSNSTAYNSLKPPYTDQEDTQDNEVIKHSGRRHSEGSGPQLPERRQRNRSTNELSMPIVRQEAEASVISKPRPRGRPRKDCSERRKPATETVETVEVAHPAEEECSAPVPEIFTCLACKFVFEEEAEMTAHIQTHSYHCQKCNVAFIAEPDFERHLLAEHPDTKQLHHCLLCKLCFACADEHAAHVASAAHSRLELTQRWTIQTLFALFTGAPCAQIAPLTDTEAAEMSSLAETVPGAINYYHQPTPLQLAVQDLLSRGVRSPPESETVTSGSTKKGSVKTEN